MPRRLTALLSGPIRRPATYAVSTWLFLRLLGAVYVIAFWSLGTQVIGLVGHDGILPAAAFMDRLRNLVGPIGVDRFRLVPTLGWISTSDAFLHGLSVAGAILGAMLAAGLAPALVLPLLWLAHLSLVIVGQDFLSYQWDALLLEVGFLSIFIAPWRLRDWLRDAADPPRVVVWLFLWVLFRLMFGSGLVKLASHDPTWHGLTALSFHFWTQPIPTPLAWYAARLPFPVLKGATAAVLFVELVVPFSVVAPRRIRAFGCATLIALQAMIAATGNYAFFNLLSVGLCLFMLDDAVWATLAGRRAVSDRRQVAGIGRKVLLVLVVGAVVPVSVFQLTSSLGIGMPGVSLVAPVATAIEPFNSVNNYGLFAVMTTARPEIIVEGSDDGTNWQEYEFKYKAGDPRRRPPWVAPHQPRLDWQMWFAALGRFDDEPWFQSFCARLLLASPDVLSLLERDPFRGRPPRYVRAELYQYRFTTAAERRTSGAWWTRERVADYSPTLTLRGGAGPIAGGNPGAR